MSSFGKKFITGLFWSLSGKFGYLAISLAANVVLARLLTPYEFGLVGIVMFFIIVSKVLTESGLSGALVRKPDATELDFTTIFIFNLVVSIALMLLLIAISGWVADFYNDSIIQHVLIALSTILFISAFQITQKTRLTKELKFKEQAKYELISVIVGSTVGISMAYCDYGVWSLVAMQVTTSAVLALMYWTGEGGVGKLRFSFKSFNELYRFGMYTTLASLINTTFDNIYHLILGKYFSVQNTGFFYQAKKLQEIPVGIINSQTQGVFFAALSKLQDDKTAFDQFYRRVISVFTVLVGLICLLLVIYAKEAILILYGEKWLGAVYYMQILAVAGYFYMQEMFNRVLFKVFDRTEKIFQLELVKKAIQSVTIALGIIYLSVDILMYGFLLTSVVSYFINYTVSRRVYGGFDWFEIMVIIQVFLAAVVTGAVALYLFQHFDLEIIWTVSFSPLVILLFVTLLAMTNTANINNELKWLINKVKKV